MSKARWLYLLQILEIIGGCLLKDKNAKRNFGELIKEAGKVE